MVTVYTANIAQLPDPKENIEVMNSLPKCEIEKILRFRHTSGRKQCLGARLLQKYVFDLYGVSLEDVTYGEHGKPKVRSIHFNLSHSHDMVVCAVGEREVGCDIEKTAAIREKIAERFFCENEVAHLNVLKGKERDEEFFRLWTMKESYMKMTGEGMNLDLKRFEFILGAPVKVIRDGKLCDCFVKEYELSDYKLTVCAEENEFDEVVKNIILY